MYWDKKPQQEVNWDKYESYPPRIKEFMMNPRAFTSRRRENICKDFILSEQFIEEYDKFLDWGCISVYQTLSEDFMRRHKDKIRWYFVTYSQKMSIEFVREFKDNITWSSFPYETMKDINFYREFRDRIDWHNFSYKFPIKEFTIEFLNEFNDVIWWKYMKFRSHQLPTEIQMRFREELVRK